jgi:hypothetical protein
MACFSHRVPFTLYFENAICRDAKGDVFDVVGGAVVLVGVLAVVGVFWEATSMDFKCHGCYRT